MKKMSGGGAVYLGYVLILWSFVALGAFVAALAFGSPALAVVAGLALIGALGGGVMAIRRGLRVKGGAWSKPGSDGHVDSYLSTYRAAADAASDGDVLRFRRAA